MVDTIHLNIVPTVAKEVVGEIRGENSVANIYWYDVGWMQWLQQGRSEEGKWWRWNRRHNSSPASTSQLTKRSCFQGNLPHPQAFQIQQYPLMLPKALLFADLVSSQQYWSLWFNHCTRSLLWSNWSFQNNPHYCQISTYTLSRDITLVCAAVSFRWLSIKRQLGPQYLRQGYWPPSELQNLPKFAELGCRSEPGWKQSALHNAHQGVCWPPVRCICSQFLWLASMSWGWAEETAEQLTILLSDSVRLPTRPTALLLFINLIQYIFWVHSYCESFDENNLLTSFAIFYGWLD